MRIAQASTCLLALRAGVASSESEKTPGQRSTQLRNTENTGQGGFQSDEGKQECSPSTLLSDEKPDTGALSCGFDEFCQANQFSRAGGYCKKFKDIARTLQTFDCDQTSECSYKTTPYILNAGDQLLCSGIISCQQSIAKVYAGGLVQCSGGRSCYKTQIGLHGGGTPLDCSGNRACYCAAVTVNNGVDVSADTYITCGTSSPFACSAYIFAYTPTTIQCQATQTCDDLYAYPESGSKVTIFCGGDATGAECNNIRFFGPKSGDVYAYDKSRFCMYCFMPSDCSGTGYGDNIPDSFISATATYGTLGVKTYGTGCDEQDRIQFCALFPSVSGCSAFTPAPSDSSMPSKSPTELPSASPSDSSMPSQSPTGLPSATPSTSLSPTGQPSASPSRSPVVEEGNCAENEDYACKFDEDGTVTHSSICVESTSKSGKTKYENKCEKNNIFKNLEIGSPVSKKGGDTLFSCGCCDRAEVGKTVSIKSEDKDYCGVALCTDVKPKLINKLCGGKKGEGGRRLGKSPALSSSKEERKRGLEKGGDFVVPFCVQEGGLQTVVCDDPFSVPAPEEGFVQCGKCP